MLAHGVGKRSLDEIRLKHLRRLNGGERRAGGRAGDDAVGRYLDRVAHRDAGRGRAALLRRADGIGDDRIRHKRARGIMDADERGTVARGQNAGQRRLGARHAADNDLGHLRQSIAVAQRRDLLEARRARDDDQLIDRGTVLHRLQRAHKHRHTADLHHQFVAPHTFGRACRQYDHRAKRLAAELCPDLPVKCHRIAPFFPLLLCTYTVVMVSL